jgi:uncharacterized protein YggE
MYGLTHGRHLLLALIAALSLLAGGLLAQSVAARSNVGAVVHQNATGHTISVGGHGEATVAPDEADITVGVQSKGQDARSALSDNSARISAVISAVEAQGVPSNHIKTSNLNIYYDSEHNVYLAQHNLLVHLDGVSNVGAVLDAAVGAGADTSWGVSFGVRDPSGARTQALQSAIVDARKRADSMATALGVTVTGVGSASEASYSQIPPVYGAQAAAGAPAAVPTPVQPGEMTISADVNVVYTFG